MNRMQGDFQVWGRTHIPRSGANKKLRDHMAEGKGRGVGASKCSPGCLVKWYQMAYTWSACQGHTKVSTSLCKNG